MPSQQLVVRERARRRRTFCGKMVVATMAAILYRSSSSSSCSVLVNAFGCVRTGTTTSTTRSAAAAASTPVLRSMSSSSSPFPSSSRQRNTAFVSDRLQRRAAGWTATTTLSSATVSSTDSTSSSSTTPTSSSSSSEDYDPQYDKTNKSNGIIGKYDPSTFEDSIYKWWENSNCFQPDAKQSKSQSDDKGKKPYVLPMPPPNVTGRLHMGHAIFVALQDVLARFHRMRGRAVLWLPGTDHAGIATQLQVEKALLAEGTSREEVGRTQFLSRVWSYKSEQGGFITTQLRSLGASADWSRERFTMDENLSKSVTEAFVRLHEKGLVYRGEYMVNWAPGLKTAVSDLEVEYSEEEGKLFYFKYVVEDSDEYLPVATTRPETIFGDTAVCVHPSDTRYKHLIGKRVMVPLSDTSRTIPIIADEYVDMEFGTGALKITPGHDVNDYALGKKFDLDIINVMNKDGTMNGNAGGTYVDMDRFDCREKLWEDMEKEGLTIKVEPHTQRIPRSQRGGEIIEPLVSSQWFVKTQGMGARALKAVQDGDIKIVPSRFEKTWYNWLEDIHDWCVSRQLWWGHRIPVWYVGESGESQYVVARNEEEARQKAINDLGLPEDVTLRQEEDVLDTWFSSGLWPFATLGWPDESSSNIDLQRFYPGSCLETGYDILFFWVARMVMLGLELTDQSPFDVVYLHGLVRAADGSKMSKTKGNVIDPLITVKEYGADSLRYSLVTGVTPGQDIPLNMDKIESNRNFANKLWNICKFVTDNALKDLPDEQLQTLAVTGPIQKEEFDTLALPERYIISKCHSLVQSVTEDIENYSLGAAGSKVYEFLWDQYADWYIEISKTRLYAALGGGGGSGVDTDDEEEGKTMNDEVQMSRRVLVYVLDTSLRLLHPYMPFVTEQLWHHIPRAELKNDGDAKVNALMLADWPQMDDTIPLVTDDKAVTQFETFQSLTKSIRNARAEYNVEPGKKISAIILAPKDDGLYDIIKEELKSLVSLSRLDPDEVTLYETGSDEATNAIANVGESVQLIVQDGVEAYLPLSGLIDPIKERARLNKRMEKLDKEIGKLQGRLNSAGFVDKAPAAVVEKARDELNELEDQKKKIRNSLDALPSSSE